MSHGPTKAELEARIADQSRFTEQQEREITELRSLVRPPLPDAEAQALSECASALAKVTTKTRPGYGSSDPYPDTDAIRRVLLHLSERFGCDLGVSIPVKVETPIDGLVDDLENVVMRWRGRA